MPVTPFHVGSGSLVKVVLRDTFSLFPLAPENALFGLVEMGELHKLCAYAGLAGFIGYFGISYFLSFTANRRRG